MRRRLFRVLLVVLALALAGCGGAQAFTLGELQVYPGAAQFDAAMNPTAAMMLELLEESVRQSSAEGLAMESALYTLPPTATWAEVKAFYTEQMGADWRVQTDFAEESEAFSSAGWSRGKSGSEQALFVGMVGDVAGDGAFLIILLATE